MFTEDYFLLPNPKEARLQGSKKKTQYRHRDDFNIKIVFTVIPLTHKIRRDDNRVILRRRVADDAMAMIARENRIL